MARELDDGGCGVVGESMENARAHLSFSSLSVPKRARAG